MSERKNSSGNYFEKEFKNIKRSLEGVHFAHYNVCNFVISLEATGKRAISAHNATQKHKKYARIKNFFAKSSQPTTTDYKAAAADGTRPYHTSKQHQSFHSSYCTFQLFKAIFLDSDVAKKFAFARTKIASIITGVFPPYG